MCGVALNKEYEMTRIFFVRHAQPDHRCCDDRTRPLTLEGKSDAKIVLEALHDKNIDLFFCSPYKRSLDTIRSTAEFYGLSITADERLRERESGKDANVKDMFRKRWENHDLHEPDGESLNMVQKRNIEVLMEILAKHRNKNIVIGTHGTALSTIINYYDPGFGCDDFMRIIDWMPYIIEFDFEDTKLIKLHELAHVYKEFKNLF